MSHSLPVIEQAGPDCHGDVLGAVGAALHEPMPGLGEGFIQYSIELEINVIKVRHCDSVDTHVGWSWDKPEVVRTHGSRVPDPLEAG